MKIKFRLGIEHQRLYNESIVNAFSLTKIQKLRVSIFLDFIIKYYENNAGQIGIYRNLIGHLRYGKSRAISCLWQHRALTLFSDGSVGFCAVKSKKIASISSDKSIWKQCLDNKNHLDEIIKNSCKDCMHDYTGIPTRSQLLTRVISRN